MPAWRIEAVTALPPALDQLRAEGRAEGFSFVDRLADDWIAGANRFEAPGERLIAAFVQDSLAGLCGLNRDPYVTRPGVARLRHLYVRGTARRTGIASALVADLLDAASPTFHTIRLRTTTAAAAAFYLKLGFTPASEATATHVKVLKR